jgi:broad specificity phosphatase PhoE
MPLIYFLRHGQTGWNAERRIQGHLDAPLNDLGRTQAARNGRALADLVGDASAFDYVSSPLVRATETMEIVRRELRLDPKGYRTDLRLREYNLGDWQGYLYADIERDFPERIAEQQRDPWNFLYPGEGGESFVLLSARVLAWFAEIERDTIVTAHGGVMRVLRRHFLGLDAEATFKLDAPQDKVMRIKNGALSWV